MNADSQIHQVELQIDVAKENVKRGKALERLLKNKDFKSLVQEGYFKDEAVRLVSLKSHPGMQDPDKQAAILKGIDAIGMFESYLRQIESFAHMSEQAIEADEQTLEELREQAAQE